MVSAAGLMKLVVIWQLAMCLTVFSSSCGASTPSRHQMKGVNYSADYARTVGVDAYVFVVLQLIP